MASPFSFPAALVGPAQPPAAFRIEVVLAPIDEASVLARTPIHPMPSNRTGDGLFAAKTQECLGLPWLPLVVAAPSGGRSPDYFASSLAGARRSERNLIGAAGAWCIRVRCVECSGTGAAGC